MSAPAQLIDLAAAPASRDRVDAWQPVESIAHLGSRSAAEAFLSILPDDADSAPRGHRRATWQH